MAVLDGSFNIPKIGPVNKKLVVGIAAVGAGFVGWRYWQARQGAAEGDVAEPGFEDPGMLPGVAGAVRDDGLYGEGSSGETSTDQFGFRGTTNDQWTQYVVVQLTQSDRWSAGLIQEACGRFINNLPLTTEQQAIIQAAIAVAGYPPVGTHVVIPGGDVPVTVAPTGLTITGKTATSITIRWNAVAGAKSYNVNRSGANMVPSTSTSITITGLAPNTSYTFSVAAVSAGGKVGPTSSPVKGNTVAITLTAPTGLKATAVTKTDITFSWRAVPGATYYRIYVNGVPRGASEPLSYRVGGLKPNTVYSLQVAADTTNQTPGPKSTALKTRTKK